MKPRILRRGIFTIIVMANVVGRVIASEEEEDLPDIEGTADSRVPSPVVQSQPGVGPRMLGSPVLEEGPFTEWSPRAKDLIYALIRWLTTPGVTYVMAEQARIEGLPSQSPEERILVDRWFHCLQYGQYNLDWVSDKIRVIPHESTGLPRFAVVGLAPEQSDRWRAWFESISVLHVTTSRVADPACLGPAILKLNSVAPGGPIPQITSRFARAPQPPPPASPSLVDRLTSIFTPDPPPGVDARRYDLEVRQVSGSPLMTGPQLELVIELIFPYMQPRACPFGHVQFFNKRLLLLPTEQRSVLQALESALNTGQYHILSGHRDFPGSLEFRPFEFLDLPGFLIMGASPQQREHWGEWQTGIGGIVDQCRRASDPTSFRIIIALMNDGVADHVVKGLWNSAITQLVVPTRLINACARLSGDQNQPTSTDGSRLLKDLGTGTDWSPTHGLGAWRTSPLSPSIHQTDFGRFFVEACPDPSSIRVLSDVRGTRRELGKLQSRVILQLMRSGVNDPRLVDRVGGLADVIDDPFVSMVAMAVTYRAGYFSVPKPWNDYFLSITSNVSYNESKVLIGPVQQEPANQFCARVAEEQNLARFGNFSPQQRLMKLLVSPNLVPDSASLQEAVTAVPGTRGVDYLRRLVEGIWNMRRLLAVAQETAEGLLAQAGYPPPVAEDRAPGED